MFVNVALAVAARRVSIVAKTSTLQAMASNQLRHDDVNLRGQKRNIKSRLEKADWRGRAVTSNEEWLDIQSVLTAVEHCRRLLLKLKSIGYVPEELDDIQEAQTYYDNIQIELDNYKSTLFESSKDWHLERPTKPSILNKLTTLRKPSMHTLAATSNEIPQGLLEAKESLQPAVENVAESSLLPSDDVPSQFDSSEAMINVMDSHATRKPRLVGATVSQTSTALQDELAQQLLKMASQLKSNAESFNSALVRDSAVVTEAQAKIEENFGSVSKERTRVRDVGQKSRGTTWLTVISILVVIIAFFLTFMVIRLT